MGAGWSPDGRRFAAYQGPLVSVFTLDGARRVLFTPTGMDQVLPDGWPPVWFPDGKQIAFLATRSDDSRPGDAVFFVRIVAAEDGQAIARYPLPRAAMGGFLHSFRWSPGGHGILVSCYRLLILDVQTGRVDVIADAEAVADWARNGEGVYYSPKTGESRGLFLRKSGSATSIL